MSILVLIGVIGSIKALMKEVPMIPTNRFLHRVGKGMDEMKASIRKMCAPSRK